MSKKDLEKAIQIVLDNDYKEMENLRNSIAYLAKQNKKHKEVIDRAIKLIEDTYYSKNTTDIDSIVLSSDKLIKVREILKEVE